MGCFLSIVMSCLSLVEFNLLFSGSICAPFSSMRGLRVFSFLFIICMKFYLKIVLEGQLGNINGIKISQ